MTNGEITFHMLNDEQALEDHDEFRTLYAEVYAEPPYEWGHEHADLFIKRFYVQARQPGFSLVEARRGAELVGVAFGVTLQPSTPWWQNLSIPLPAEITDEWPGRTFALVELLVRRPWRRRHIAQRMHDLLLRDRLEERFTLTVLPAAEAARCAYAKWGWREITQKRNPLPGASIFNVLTKDSQLASEDPANSI